MSEPSEELRQMKLRIAVLLARGREARARAEGLLERSALIARGNRLAPPRAPVRAADDD